ncbi:hypothetical protein IMY05_016G0088800 [Salix suchowensis]|nr:hypothetical protein IMY05_016G0088800 [Salix suchowensis]
MRIPNPRLSFLFLMIILAISQLASCRHLQINIGDQTNQTVSTHFSRDFPAKAPEGSHKDEIDDPVYGASFRKTPADFGFTITLLLE